MDEIQIHDLTERLQQLLEEKSYRELKRELDEVYPMDLAEILDELDTDSGVIFFRLLPKDRAAEVFSYLGTARRKEIVSSIHSRLLEYIFNELYFDDKIDFLEEMPANFVRDLVRNSPPEERALINQFLQYPDNSAGSIMTIEYVDLLKTMTVRDALARIRATGQDKETIYTCYVLDAKRHMEGVISLKRLVLSDDDDIVGDLMDDDVICCDVTDDQEQVADVFKRYDLIAVPVVDGEKRLIGLITIDDIVDVIEQENTEDFQKMAAMTPSDEAYLDTGVFNLAKRRVVWLLVLMISGTLTGSIIDHYSEMLATAVFLASAIPMLMDSGGNAGSQSSTLIIRGIALGEIGSSDWLRILWKEIRVGLIAGGSLAVVNAGRMFLVGARDAMSILTVSLTLMSTILIAKVVGGLLPIGAKRLGLDPAIMASPLITTIVDALALIIYFGLASWLVL